MTINDDMLNRYLDGELNDDEKRELEKELEYSPDLLKKMKFLKAVDSSLRNTAIESPSPGFTATVMKKLRRKSSSKQQNYFFYFVFGIIALLSVGVTAYIAAAVLGSPEEPSFTFDMSQGLNSFINNFTHFAAGLIKPEFFSVIGSVVSCILIITGYFFFENIKNLKKMSR